MPKRKPKNTEDFLIKTVAISICTIIFAGASYLYYHRSPIKFTEKGKPSNDNKTINEKSPAAEEVRQAVDNINARVSSISLKKSYIIFKDQPPPRFQYALMINPQQANNPNADVYLFDRYEYIVSTGGINQKTPTQAVCDLIDEIYDRKDPILEALREAKLGGKISFPFWKFTAELEAGNVTPVLVEMLYAARKFRELKKTRPEILVRGYADGQTVPWERPLAPNRDYRNISVFPYEEPDSESPSTYLRKEQPLSVGSKYTNKDLPDLRANYVKEELIDPYLSFCREMNPETHILKGFEFTKLINQPLERKVEVFILIYDKES